jgi:PAS domain S-box-containing protein
MAADLAAKPDPALRGRAPGDTDGDPLTGSDSLLPTSPGGKVHRVRVLVPERGLRRAARAEVCGCDDCCRGLLQAADIIPWEADADTRQFTRVGPQAIPILGYPLHQWYEKGFWAAHLHPDDRERATDRCRRYCQQGEDFDLEYRMVAADGRTVWLHDRAAVEGSEGQPKTLRGFMMDVSEGKRAEKALQESERRYRTLFEKANDAIFLETEDDAIVAVNQRACDLLGYSHEELLAMKVPDLQAPEVRGRPGTVIKGELRKHQDNRFEGLDLHRDGRRIPVEITDAVIVENGQRLVLSIVRDITERKQGEEALRQALREVRRLKDELQAENVYLREEIRGAHQFGKTIGESPAIKQVLRQAEQVAGTDATVLLLGETGTGKELLATAIHDLSPRRDRAMVKVNCAALPAPLVESELFGREKGAFTGALSKQAGRFELAHGSTIFLDEVGDLPPEVQVKLLRVLQEGTLEHLGSPRPIRVNVRVIAATNRDLAQAVRDGRFREDLFYRLNVFPISVPPLRERAEDIPLLVWAFVEEFARALGKTVRVVAKGSMEALRRYPWPGNVRELRNIIERAMIANSGPTLQVALPGVSDSPTARSMGLVDFEREHILHVLELTRWRVRGKAGAAEILRIKPTTLESRMAKLGIQRPGKSSDIS